MKIQISNQIRTLLWHPHTLISIVTKMCVSESICTLSTGNELHTYIHALEWRTKWFQEILTTKEVNYTVVQYWNADFL